FLRSQPDKAHASFVDLLATINMETKAHDRALQHIEHACFSDLKSENAIEHVELVTGAADSLMELRHYDSVLGSR
ncbi:hypothetical protein HN51_012493, partial [Arachis hypogaea]